MGNYKETRKVNIPAVPEGYVMPKVRVAYPLYRVLSKALRAEGVDPHTRLEVVEPE